MPDKTLLYQYGLGDGYCLDTDEELFGEPFIPVNRGLNDWLFVETWSVYGGGEIEVSYSKELTDLVGINNIRKNAEKRHKCELREIKRLTIPYDCFDDIYKECVENGCFVGRYYEDLDI